MKNNVKHIWSLSCRKTLVDSDSNILNIIEVLEQINIDSAQPIKFNSNSPTMLPFDFTVVSYWRKLVKDKVEHDARLVLLSPKGKTLLKTPVRFEIPSNKKSMRTIAKLRAFPLVGDGVYTIEVQEKIGTNYTRVAEIPIEVIIHGVFTA